MKPGEIITDKERIERLVEMLRPYKHMGRHPHAYVYDGKLYIEMPSLMVVYDYYVYAEWHRAKLKGDNS